ncbi:Putative ATP-dependent helicase lhr [Minicystis rosea]|nr:Putative ATP-dependent helicase lhr [Minicystis rosea]
MPKASSVLSSFHAPVRTWFAASFAEATGAQQKGWPAILSGASTLLFAPTGSGKTLAAFLVAIDRLMFSPEPHKTERCRVLYVSPLKALGTDVERNLRAPIAGIAAVAEREGVPFRVPTVAVRSGDTPAGERARIGKQPPDILIITPESLYLMLTSSARAGLASVETVIIDEIHSLVPTKRGAHLFLSLERLESLRPRNAPPLQRIGLSATQRPLEEVARLLGGGELGVGGEGTFQPRPVTIVDAGTKKAWDLRVEVPVEDMSKLGEIEELPSGSAAQGPKRRSIWPSIHPRLVELVRAHRSTMIFANSRRLAERLAGALNETAGEEIALAHHGSIAKETRLAIEDRLKRGELPAIVATSSLELGLDLGAVDLVVQIESPPSVASGLQRIGRAGHSVGAVSRGVIFPKYRGDLLSSATATARMVAGEVEEMFYPRNPLDILAQHIVATVSMDATTADALFAMVRRAAPFAELPKASFEGVLDMLSGRYPSDEFAELRPRITWDRTTGRLTAREGARRIAVVSGGTIPDRGLYGVYLADEGDGKKSRRVGELDEEMVFESRAGDVFLLGASSWRITEITHDRVLVVPAPGEPGKMPFWRGDRPGRPPELGRAIGALARTLLAEKPAAARKRLREHHGLDERAADNLLAYLREQAEATGEVPSDRTIVVERYKDEIGDYRVCVLSPFGSRVHAPWCTAVLARLRTASDQDLEGIWSDDGMVFRFPGSDEPPAIDALLPSADEIEDLVVQSLGGSSVFAARFRENAGRALLLPRRHPGQRSPLWATRKKAADLLAVASRYGSFPLILETYRECLRDVFDLPGLVELLRQIASRKVRVLTVDTRVASPFAASLMFSYVGNFLYDGDAPLAERRAHALSVDPAQLKELLGEAELRELLDADAIFELERGLQRLDGHRPATHADGLHDLLLSIGDLTEDEIAARTAPPEAARGFIDELSRDRRIVSFTVAGERRWAAAEDAARLRDALGVVPPRGLPAALLEPVKDPLGDLLSRYARTHGPFLIESAAARFGLGIAPVRTALERLAAAGRVVEGEISPGRRSREWCDVEVLRSLKRRSLAKLRKEVEPVPQDALGRFAVEWHGLTRSRSGPMPCSPSSSSSKARRCRPRCSKPTCSRRASKAIAPRISISSAPPARSRGSASSPSVRTTARSRSTSSISSLCSGPRPAAPKASSARACATSSSNAAPSSSPISSRRPAPFKTISSPRSGISCGPARSRTTPSRLSAAISVAPPRRPRSAARPSAARASDRAASVHPAAKAAGRSWAAAAARLRRRSVAPRSRACSWSGTAWSRVKRCRPRASPAASPQCTRCSRPWRTRAACVAAISWPASAPRSSRSPARTIACAPPASLPRIRAPSSSPPPIPRTLTAPRSRGPRRPPTATLPARARSAPPARTWCCSTARSWATWAAPRRTCSPSSRRTSPSVATPPPPSRARCPRSWTMVAAAPSWSRAWTARTPSDPPSAPSSSPPASPPRARDISSAPPCSGSCRCPRATRSIASRRRSAKPSPARSWSPFLLRSPRSPRRSSKAAPSPRWRRAERTCSSISTTAARSTPTCA